MNQKYNKTENPKGRSGHSVPLQDRHNASSRPRLFFRLGCAALALMLAVGGVSLLRSSFEAQLPMVHAAGAQTINEYGIWDSDDKMEPGQTSLDVDKIYVNAGGVIRIRKGKTINMVTQPTLEPV